MSTADLLLEIGCEDLPARFVEPLAKELGNLSAQLNNAGVETGEQTLFATPRRIAVLISEVALKQADQKIERKGPKLVAAIKDGKPSPAGLGFAKSCGVEFDALEQEDGQLVFRASESGKNTQELLQGFFEESLKRMDQMVPKRMRWGSSSETFVRPVQWLCCIFGGEIIPLNKFGITASNITFGHRFHAPEAITLNTASEYAEKLRAADVEPDFESRVQTIREQVIAEGQKLGGEALVSDSLLREVAALVEKPVVISGRMEEKFMQLPPEVIVTTVETNQRYFTVFKDAEHTTLLPYFITVSNIQSTDVQKVIEGNERVVRPRLADALFFWDQDCKKKLHAFLPELDRVTYQKHLGSIGDKAKRIVELSSKLATDLNADATSVKRAATLCKADLVTSTVFEFPELQGIMGGYYALKSGEDAAIATAIKEHYLPTQQGTPIPSNIAGQIVSVADKLDSLAGIFAIGQKPTASKDPYALRRAANGVLRILIEGKLALDLRALSIAALSAQPVKAPRDTDNDLYEFVLERLRAYFSDAGFTTEQFEAVKASGTSSPLDFSERMNAIRIFSELAEAADLAAANKRARNILKQAGTLESSEIDTSLFSEKAETDLYTALKNLPDNDTTDYVSQLKQLAALRTPVDSFFNDVMVNADDPNIKANRLALLHAFDARCRSVADLSCLSG